MSAINQIKKLSPIKFSKLEYKNNFARASMASLKPSLYPLEVDGCLINLIELPCHYAKKEDIKQVC